VIDSFASAAQCAQDALDDPGGLRYTHLPTLVGFVAGLDPGESPADWSAPALLVGVRLGRLLLELGLREDAEQVLRTLADQLPSVDGEEAVELANALGALGVSLGLLDEAGAVLHRADLLLLADPAVRTSDRIRTLVNLAAVELSQGKPREAAVHVMSARGLVAGSDTPPSSRVRELLAAVELRLVRSGMPTSVSPAEAVAELADRAAELVEELGDSDPRSFLAVADVAVARFQAALEAGDTTGLEEAQKVLEVAAQRLSALLGADHPQALGVQADLVAVQVEAARVARSPARLERSVQLLESVGRRLEARLGPTHPRSAAALTNLVSAQVESVRAADEPGKAERTVTLLAERARRTGQLFGEAHPVTRLVRASLAECRKIAAGEGDAHGGGTTMLLTRRDSLGDWGHEEGDYRSLDDLLRNVQERLESLRRLEVGETSYPVALWDRSRARDEERLRPEDYLLPPLPGGTHESRLHYARLLAYLEIGAPLSSLLYPPSSSSPLVSRSSLPQPLRHLADEDVQLAVVEALDEEGATVTGQASGFVPADELSVWSALDPDRVLAVGERVRVVHLGRRGRDGRPLLSMKRAEAHLARQIIDHARRFTSGAVTGVVVRVHTVGLILDLGVPGLLPAAMIASHPVRDLQPYLGRELTAKVLDMPQPDGIVLLSRRAWLEETREGAHRRPPWESADPLTADHNWLSFARTHKPGQIVPGEVTGFASLGVGAFVRVADGVEGLVPAFELAEGARSAHRVVRVGEEVFVRILALDPVRRTIDLSVRMADRTLGDDPAEAEFDPALYGAFLYDEEGNPIPPEDFGIAPRTRRRARREWRTRYNEAKACFERHRQRVIRDRRREIGD
jgi:predicted RNA-binding protein with RPS1 domain